MTKSKKKKSPAKKAGAPRSRRRLNADDKAYIVAQMAGLKGPKAKKQAKRLAKRYSVTCQHIYAVTRHVRPRRRPRSDKRLLNPELKQLLAGAESIEDYDFVIGVLKTQLGNKTLQPGEYARLSQELRGAEKDRIDLIQRLDYQRRAEELNHKNEAAGAEEAEDSPPSIMEEFCRSYYRAWILDSPRNLANTLGFEVARIHKKMLDHEDSHPDGSLSLSFRGSGKTTILTVNCAIYELLRNPDIRICIISDTGHQARAIVYQIATILMSNEDLIWLFGYFYDSKKKWTESKITIAQRTKIFREGTVEAYGFDTAVVGGHFDIMIYDDAVSEENSRTEYQRERLKTKYLKKFKPCLMPDGSERFRGTRYHFSDLYCTLMQDAFKDSTLVIPAIRLVNDREYSAWPQLFPIRKLRKLRRELGTMIFNAQFMNDTEAMKGSIFKYEWMRFCNRDDVPKELRIFQGVDLAISKKNTADYFAIVTVGQDPKKKEWYVLDSYRARLSFRQQTALIIQKFRQFDSIRVAIEANAYQAAMVQEIRELSAVRARAVMTHKDKVTRAWKLSALFEDGRIIFVKGQETLVNELLSFPGADHDDLFDGLDLAISGGRGSGKIVH